MRLLTPAVRAALLAAALTGAIVAVGAGGCTKNNAVPNPTVSVSPVPSGSPVASPSPGPSPAYIVGMSYPDVGATTDPTYGKIDGYSMLVAIPTASNSPPASPAPQIINVNANMTIQFFTMDVSSHTASLLGAVAPSPSPSTWPATFNNSNGKTASVPGTMITQSEFSTGAVTGRFIGSAVYNTGTPGMYYFADFDNYLSNPPMRTIIIVH